MPAPGAEPTCRDVIAAAENELRAAGIDTARLDAEVLLSHALDLGRAGLYARLGDPVAPGDRARFDALVGRRRDREPVAYLTGRQEFWSLDFRVTEDVLVPRPETELLVEAALGLVQRDAGCGPLVCDVGTGSGCIAVALARELPRARVVAVDLSATALAVARRNARAHGVESRIAFLRSDLLEGIAPQVRFDLVVSNPPYVADAEELPPEVRREPATALYAGPDGLDVIRRLVDQAAERLQPGAWLAMEIGFGQADAAVELTSRRGFRNASVRSDLAGIPRVLLVQHEPSCR